MSLSKPVPNSGIAKPHKHHLYTETCCMELRYGRKHLQLKNINLENMHTVSHTLLLHNLGGYSSGGCRCHSHWLLQQKRTNTETQGSKSERTEMRLKRICTKRHEGTNHEKWQEKWSSTITGRWTCREPKNLLKELIRCMAMLIIVLLNFSLKLINKMGKW